LDGIEFVYEAGADEYDPATCVTADELRGQGIPVPDDVPGCGWIHRAAIRARQVGVVQAADGSYQGAIEVSFLEPFRWLEAGFITERAI